jgi:hypothetical protein
VTRYRVEYHVDYPDNRIVGTRAVEAPNWWTAMRAVERNLSGEHPDVVVDRAVEVTS